MDKLAGNSFAAFDRKIQHNTDRAAYEYLKGKQKLPFGNQDRMNPNATITEGYLRSEVDLGVQNAIRFPIKIGDPNTTGSGTERLLQNSQMFLVTQIGLMLYLATDSPTNAIRAQASLHSYPAIEVNAGTNDVNVIYNGSLECRVDQVTYFDGLDTARFLRAGQAQEGLEVSTGATNPAYVQDQWDTQNWGMYRLTPFIFFGGQSDNVVTLSLPANIDLTDNNATVVALFRGLLIQNAYANNQ